MPLPETPREIYRRNPLAEVLVQLKFPIILRVDTELPAQFQEAIRDSFPTYRQVPVAGPLPPEIPLPPNIPPQFRNLIQGMGGPSGSIQHQFETQDQRWTLTLTREVFSLRTTAYDRWEAFCNRLAGLRAAFERIYRPVSYTRINLRYVDVIRRSTLGLAGVSWAELLNPAVAGELATTELGGNVQSMSRQSHCGLDGDNIFLWLKSGIAKPKSAKDTEQCFFIDGDFHTHAPTEVANVTNTLNEFNRRSGNLFRWSIRERLRTSLEPIPIG